MSFRSGITRAGLDHGTLSFPIIFAPTPPGGPFNAGDLAFYEGDFGTVPSEVMEDINELIHSCRDAWQELGIEAEGIDPTQALGITAVNINMFRDLDGNPSLLGFAGCETALGASFMDCEDPLDAFIVVTDNSYIYPGHANNLFVLTDPKDITVGHELGHALGLLHRNQNPQLPVDPMALMNECLTDDGSTCQSTSPGVADNTLLDPSEVATLTANAAKANGLEIDPPGVFLPGSWVAARRMDRIKEIDPPATPLPRRHLDIVSVLVGLDTQTDLLTLKQELLGLIPTQGRGQEHWWLLDTDNDRSTGADPSLLPQLIGSPRTTFEGTDLAVRVEVRDGLGISDTVWQFIDGAFVALPASVHSSRLTSMVLRGLPPPGVSLNPVFEEVPINQFVKTDILNDRLRIPIALDQPICIQSMTADLESGQERNPVDELDSEGLGCGIILRIPEFPHCFPEGSVAAGDSVLVAYDGLLPNTEIHVLLGPELVLDGVFTNANGEGGVQMPIPADATAGLHLVTIGHDGLALTADCTVNVVRPCEDSEFSTCGGECPPLSECLPLSFGGGCFCAPIECGDSEAPECGGVCPADSQCQEAAGSGVCRCVLCNVAVPAGRIDISWTSNTQFTWNRLECAETYNVYRSSQLQFMDLNGDGLADDYGSCFVSETSSTEASDFFVPAGFFNAYMVVGENRNGEGAIGTNSAGMPRRVSVPCP